MILLIPAYEPTASLVELIRTARTVAPLMIVVVVDDGSGAGFDAVFRSAEAEGADVLRYRGNRGKGFALRAGFQRVLERYRGEAVVTADSDGQHSITDIMRVADRVTAGAAPIVLGGRRFSGDVPARSRLGNSVSRLAFRAATGESIHDTQTGLRGFSADTLPWLLTIDGDRFEYELNVLLGAIAEGRPVDEIPISTIYLEHNASSHFRPIVDSVRVMRPLVRFGAVSFGSFVIDVVVLELLFFISSSLVLSVVGARVASATANFLANRALVFGAKSTGTGSDRRGFVRSALRYLVLAVCLLAASYASIGALTGLGMPLLAAKILTDVTLYAVSFQVQRTVVFARARTSPAAPQPQLEGATPASHSG